MGNRRRNRRTPPLDAATAAELLAGRAQTPEDTHEKISWNLPRPEIDERDPYGKLEAVLLSALGVKDDHDARITYKRLHPKFAELYEHLLQQGLDAAEHSRDLAPKVAAFLVQATGGPERKQ